MLFELFIAYLVYCELVVYIGIFVCDLKPECCIEGVM